MGPYSFSSLDKRREKHTSREYLTTRVGLFDLAIAEPRLPMHNKYSQTCNRKQPILDPIKQPR